MFVLCSRVIRSSRLLDSSHLVAAVFAEVENALSKKLPLRLLQLDLFSRLRITQSLLRSTTGRRPRSRSAHQPHPSVRERASHFEEDAKDASSSSTPARGQQLLSSVALRFVCCVVFVSALVEPAPVPWFLFQHSWEREVAPVRLCRFLSVSCWFTVVLCEPPSAVLVPD